MSSSGEDYIISRQKKIDQKKKILTVVGLVSFVGSTLFGLVNLAQQSHQQQPQTKTTSIESGLQQQARGYELVLKREPNNQTALEKLALVRVQLKDFNGARELLEKLVHLYPDRQDYKLVLEDIKKRQ